MDRRSSGEILVFINFLQAARFGHVAYGFQVGDDEFVFGSTDHLWKHEWWDLPAWVRYMNVPPAGDIDWWLERGNRAAMLKQMKSGHHIRYHAFKSMQIADAYPHKALEAAVSLQHGGWHLAKHNCVHQTYRIMDEYCKEHNFPNPHEDALNLIPKRWFSILPGPQEIL